MFHGEYLRTKKLYEKLAEKIVEREERMNQDISIRDIMVYPESSGLSYGEVPRYDSLSEDLLKLLRPEDFEHIRMVDMFTKLAGKVIPARFAKVLPDLRSREINNPYQHYDRIIRLVDHIEVLAQIANIYHLKYYNTPNCKNKITRLLLNEFSLYTTTPLSLKEFSLLLEAARTIAAQQQENVHLLLSSMAVFTDNGKILNITLYLQCGIEPKINIFAKGRASLVDIAYADYTNFSQDETPNFMPDVLNVSEFIALQEGLVISNNSVFTITTAGGAQYTQAVDVCVDYTYLHAKSLFSKSHLRDLTENQNIIPAQVDHVVTSNSLQFQKYPGKIANLPVQIDPRYNIKKHMNSDKVSADDIQHIKKNKYSQMTVDVCADGIELSNPPFGSKCRIVATEERKMGGFAADLVNCVASRNIGVKHYILSTQLGMAMHGPAYLELLEKYVTAVKDVNSLYQSLFSYAINNDTTFVIRHILQKSKRKLLEIKDPADFLRALPDELTKLQVGLQSLATDKPSKTIDAMLVKIADIVNRSLVTTPSVTLK